MQDEALKHRIQKLRDENLRKVHQLRVALGESLLLSRGIMLAARAVDRERVAQIEAYRYDIRSTTRELENWKQLRDRAANRGLLKQLQFRQQMIAGMKNDLDRYMEELRQLRSIPRSFWTAST